MVSNANVNNIGQSWANRPKLFSFPSAGDHQKFFVFWWQFDKYRMLWEEREEFWWDLQQQSQQYTWSK